MNTGILSKVDTITKMKMTLIPTRAKIANISNYN